MTQLSLVVLAPPKVWSHIPVEDPRAAALCDRHYSRQTVGSDGVLPPGQRFLLWHEDAAGRAALWGVVRNIFRDEYRWRNAVFRNESSTLSSTLIREATTATLAMWERRYKGIPDEPLLTEIGIDERSGSTRPPRAARGAARRASATRWPDGSSFGSRRAGTVDRRRRSTARCQRPIDGRRSRGSGCSSGNGSRSRRTRSGELRRRQRDHREQARRRKQSREKKR